MEGIQTYMLRLPTGQQFGPANMDMLVQWAREGRVPRDGLLVPQAVEGAFATEPIRVLDAPRLATVLLATPTTVPGPMVAPRGDSGISTLIPYRNGPALAAYYVGVFSLIPALGAILAVIAIILGFVGFSKSLKDKQAKGAVHAWIGIVLGLVSLIGHGVALVVFANIM